MQGSPCGEGVRRFPDNVTISGTLVNGVFAGLGMKTWPDGRTYAGELVSNEMHGTGTLVWPDKRKYTGLMSDGAMEGHGVTTWVVKGPGGGDGDWEIKYEGEMHQNMFHGAGKLELPNGDQYNGNFVDGSFHAQGEYLWVNDGSSYCGEWCNGSMDGEGMMSKAGGTTYKGQFSANQAHGHGQQTFANGDQYVGEWENSCMQGAGVCTWANGVRYTGQFLANEAHGSGMKVWPDGSQYVGEFQNGMRWGRGVHVTQDVRIVGVWSEDKIVSQLLERVDADGAKYFEGPVSAAQCQALTSTQGATLLASLQSDEVKVENLLQSIIYANGECFVGQTSDCKPHGHGLYIRADGTWLCGTWDHDELTNQVVDTSTCDVLHSVSLQQLRTGNLLATERQCRHL